MARSSDMSKIDKELTEGLTKCIEAALTDEAMRGFVKQVRDLSVELEEFLMWSVKDNMAYNLSSWVVDMAERSLEQMLLGNEDQMRRYLSCEKRAETGEYIGWTGRDRDHPVIHGRLFETGAVQLRKAVAQANEKLILDERILDLQDQVRSLVEQVNKANAQREEMWQRLCDARVDA